MSDDKDLSNFPEEEMSAEELANQLLMQEIQAVDPLAPPDSSSYLSDLEAVGVEVPIPVAEVNEYNFNEAEGMDIDTLLEVFEENLNESGLSEEMPNVPEEYFNIKDAVNIIDEHQLMAEQIPDLNQKEWPLDPIGKSDDLENVPVNAQKVEVSGSELEVEDKNPPEPEPETEEYPPPSPTIWEKTVSKVPAPEIIEPTDWKERVHLMNADFLAIYNYPETKFPNENSIVVIGGRLYATQIPLDGYKIVLGVKGNANSVIPHFINLTIGKDYNLVCGENHRFILFGKSSPDSTNNSLALVNIYSFPQTSDSVPEIPIRPNQEYRLIAYGNLTFKIRQFSPVIPPGSLVETPADYFVPLKLSLNDPSYSSLFCKLNVSIQCKFSAVKTQANQSITKIVTFVTTPISVAEPIPFPEIEQETEPWKTEVHKMNQDLRLILDISNSSFIKITKKNEFFASAQNGLLAFRLPQNFSIRLSTKYLKTHVINATVIPGNSYLIIRKRDELWNVTCETAIVPETPPAVIRVLTIKQSESKALPFRSNMPFITLLRSGVDFLVHVLPKDFPRNLLLRLESVNTPKLIEIRPQKETLRLEMIDYYRIRVISDKLNEIQVARVHITDKFGSGDIEMGKIKRAIKYGSTPFKLSDFHAYSK